MLEYQKTTVYWFSKDSPPPSLSILDKVDFCAFLFKLFEIFTNYCGLVNGYVKERKKKKGKRIGVASLIKVPACPTKFLIVDESLQLLLF